MLKNSVTYSLELAMKICEHLASGKSLVQVCRLKGMPKTTAIHRWRLDGKHEDFARMYRIAREIQVEGHYDELIKLSDSAQGLDSAGVQAVKLAVDTRKWALVKLVPNTYGDRIDHTHGANESLRSLMESIETDADVGPGPSKSRRDQPSADTDNDTLH